MYILSPSKAHKDILTIVQWSSYDNFWYILITCMGHIWICTYHSIHDGSNHSYGFTHQVSKTLESYFNLFRAARTFVIVAYWTSFNISYMYFNTTILAPRSITIDIDTQYFWFCLSLSLKSNFNEIFNLCQQKIHHFQLTTCLLHNVL
jgi:hypothetical protein